MYKTDVHSAAHVSPAINAPRIPDIAVGVSSKLGGSQAQLVLRTSSWELSGAQ